MAETHYTLLQLNSIIKNTVREVFAEPLWVIGEIHEIKENYSGHCYLELVEKARNSDQIVARAKATIWVMTWRMLKPYFETSTGQELDAGIKVLVNVTVEFHELYGFSLNIKDIDPVYTLGDLEQKKAEIIRKLEAEGIMDMNKGLILSDVPQRVAVISSKTAAGLQDFLDQIWSNPYGYKIYVKLYEAVMQGKQAETSIIQALDQINDKIEKFDAVVMIRGGGAKSDLNCFNSYLVTSHIAQFPLPVITGIGHERDITITDLVSHTSVKTPTAAAEFILSRINNFENELLEIQYNLAEKSADIVSLEKEKLSALMTKVYPSLKSKIGNELRKLEKLENIYPGALKNFFIHKGYAMKNIAEKVKIYPAKGLSQKTGIISLQINSLNSQVKNYLSKKDYPLHFLEDIVKLNHPDNILKRGFAIVTHNGRMVKSARVLKKSDIIATKFADGRIESIVGNVETE